MSKRYESEADRVWRDKIDHRLSFEETMALICALGALAGILLIASVVTAPTV